MKNKHLITVALIMIIVLIFIIDALVLKSHSAWLLYLFLLIIAAWNIPIFDVYILSIICSGLILWDFFGTNYGYSNLGVFNSLLVIAVLWMITILSIRYNRIKKRLERSEALLVNTQELAHLGSFKIDINSQELFFTEESKRIFGFDSKGNDVPLAYALDRIHPDERKEISLEIERLVKKKRPVEMDYRLLLPEKDEIKFIHSISRPVLNRKGEVDSIIGTLLDVTREKISTIELKQSEMLFRQVWENSFDGMRLIDQKGDIVRVNEAFCKMVEIEREKLEGNSFADIYAKSREEKLAKGLSRFAKKTVVPYTVEEFELWNGKKKWFEVSNCVLDFENREPLILSIFRDVTERKNFEEELKNTVNKLEISNKNLQEFAYVASHDLQEPLRMISNYTQLLSNRFSKNVDEKAKEYIYFVVSSAKRMQELIKNLLDYSRVTTQGKAFETLDSSEILENVLSRMKLSIEETGTKLIISSLPKIKGDSIQIEQLFQNLLSNSIKFRSNKEPVIQISAEDKDNLWLFSFRDNGIGIEQKFKDRIFVIFQRLHSQQEYPGTGIGLALCKKIVERHGGNIWMESTPGEGTTFYFTIPKAL
ncbi:MAG: ATP-binding protein [Bacteroidota bacterium]|nr:ATP-binding protein [Bacteroidota bacterium]